jgi:hypothetical protein
MSRAKPIGSLSLDLDNLWSYLKTHGDAGWESFPSYLDLLVPRVLDFLAARKLKITFFVVGQDAALPECRAALRAIAGAGHEIGNHSFRHDPWMHEYDDAEIEAEIARTEDTLEEATGRRPVGFRGPGYSLSPAILRILARRGYRYDASTLPMYIGPLARLYYMMTVRQMSDRDAARRKSLFGGFRQGLRPLAPYRWQTSDGPIVEIPVSTMPLFKLPFHVSYLLYLSSFSERLAHAYFGAALQLCRWSGTSVSMLLHPLDFLGGDDVQGLDFFPAMKLPGARKVEFTGKIIDRLSANFDLQTMSEHAAVAEESGRLHTRRTTADRAFPRIPPRPASQVPV